MKAYPFFKTSDHVENRFGHILPDPYEQMRNPKDPAVLKWVDEENSFTDDWFDAQELQQEIAAIKAASRPELPASISPWHDGYLATMHEEGNYTIVSLDQNLALQQTLLVRYDLPGMTPFLAAACPQQEDCLNILAQTDGAARPSQVIYDAVSRKIKMIAEGSFSGVWSKHQKVLYYSDTCMENGISVSFLRAYSIETEEIRTLLRSPGSIFGQLALSEDGDTLMCGMCSDYSHIIFYSYREESDTLTCLNPSGAREWKYLDTIDHKHCFITAEDAVHGRIIYVPDGKDDSEETQLRSETDEFLDSGFALNGSLYLLLTKDSCSRLIEADTNREIPMPDAIGSLSEAGMSRHERLFHFDSFTGQPQMLAFDGSALVSMSSGIGQDPEVTAELCYAPSAADQQMIPFYLVHRKDIAPNGSLPVLMYGYGGYNVAMPPWSREVVTGTDIIRWAKQGGLYVHCLLRGGSEYGPAWHEAGMLMHKKNCYGDFIGIAEQLIRDGWTSASRIAISGCSNGGLLMSALVTMRPDLFGCVIDSVPHTDMIHFAEDDRGLMYITEYGNPKESKEMFEYLLSYSPLHNVRKAAYPPVYIQTGECDNNVPPYHGKSLAAAMQAANTSDHPILLRVLPLGAHDRGQGDVYWKTTAEMQLFIRKALHLQ